MEEEARGREGNRDRAVECLSTFRKEVLQSRQEEEDPFISSFLCSPRSHNPNLVASHYCLYYTDWTIHHCRAHTQLHQRLFFFISQPFVFFSGFISRFAPCNLAPALPFKRLIHHLAAPRGKLALIRNVEASPCCSGHLYFTIPTIRTSPGVTVPALPLSPP